MSIAQALAAKNLSAKAAQGGYSVTLLDGVTGSGKTEVYFDAIAAALAAGKQVLVLLPEIALSAQLLARFVERFGAPPAEWHSDLGEASRRATWRAVAEGQARVVVGARSALFLPFPELGLIVVDEEHETSFKQEEGVIYHARDMAVVRASLAEIPIVLVSATPSLETTVNVEQGRYARLHLAGAPRHGAIARDSRDRYAPRHRPSASASCRRRWSRRSSDTLEAGEQAMLFLNRRGYAPLTLCRACGYRLQCPNCTAWLVEHRLHGRLQCHHCGHAEPLPPLCPQCGAAGSFAPCGPGVERLGRGGGGALSRRAVAVMASDTLAGPRAMPKNYSNASRRTRHRRADRHAGDGQGPSFPDADAGRRGRRRSRPGRRRSARGRANVSAAPPGGGPRRAAPSGRAWSISRPSCPSIR